MDASQATHHIVERLLGDWVCLQIAIQHGMGGSDARLKERWMAQVVSDYLIKENDLDPTEVEDYLAEILFAEFDTVVNDGTLPGISALMLQLHKLCRDGRIQEALSQLPANRPSMPTVNAEPEQNLDEEMIVCDAEVDEIAAQVSNLGSRESRRRTAEPDEDGWVTVGKGGNK